MDQNDLYRLASKSIAGLTQFGTELGVAHCTAADLTAVRAAAANKRAAFDAARTARTQAYAAIRAVRDAADAYLMRSRDHLRHQLGQRHNGLWTQLGFTGNTLDLPNTDEKRLRVLARFRTYFEENPTHENAAFGITRTRGDELHAALFAAAAAVTACLHDNRVKRDDRKAAEAALLKKLRGLWKELAVLLEPTDPRWLRFIDRMPGALRMPDAVAEVSATAQPGGIIVLDWESTTRAARYKVLKQIVGVDAEPVLADTVADNDAQITGVPSGVTVRLQIVATNEAGDAAASPVVELLAAA